MASRSCLAVSAALALISLVACSDHEPGPVGNGPDAALGFDAGNLSACTALMATTATLSNYPASYDGDWAGAGADLTPPAGCTGTQPFTTQGNDVVVGLTGLVAGTRYAVRGTTPTSAEIGVYVVPGCEPTGALAACLAAADQGIATAFTAPASGKAYVVVDNHDLQAAGTPVPFHLDVFAAECEDDAGCTGSAKRCAFYRCVECLGAADCIDPARPACDSDLTCTDLDHCTGDDAFEPGNDTRAGAVLLTPSAAAPVTLDLAVCSEPHAEIDYIRVHLAEAAALAIRVDYAAGSNLAVWFDTGTRFIGGAQSPPSRLATGPLAAGDYYLEINKFAPAGVAASTPYTVHVAYADCATSHDCNAAAPICDSGECVAGPSCTGDDAAEPGDDGPAGATPFTPAPGQTLSHQGKLCGAGGETDWLRDDVASGDSLEARLTWADTAHELDLRVVDVADGTLGLDRLRRPAQVNVTFLPAGSYWLRVEARDTSTAATPYTLSLTRSAGACTGALDCAAAFETQLHRGNCSAQGACTPIAGAGALALGARCDSNDDCQGAGCSNDLFEAHAERDVCTALCASNADCDALGAGFRCTTQVGQGYCKAACTSDVDCGANLDSGTPDPGRAWDYYTCNVATGACAP